MLEESIVILYDKKTITKMNHIWMNQQHGKNNIASSL